MKDKMSQEAFSAAIALILRHARLSFDDQYVQCIPVHWEVIPQGLVSMRFSSMLIIPRILKFWNKFWSEGVEDWAISCVEMQVEIIMISEFL